MKRRRVARNQIGSDGRNRPQCDASTHIRIVESNARAGDIHLIQHGTRMRQERTPRFRHANATPEPVEQLHIQFFLKLQHLL